MSEDNERRIGKMVHIKEVFDGMNRDCMTCDGSGRIKGQMCTVCMGKGRVKYQDTSDRPVMSGKEQ